MKLTLRNILIWVAALFAILVFVFSFLPEVRFINSLSDSSYLHIIWGSDIVRNNANGQTAALDPKLGGAGLAIAGAFLALVGGLCALCLSFFGEKLFKDAKVLRIVMFVAAGLLVLGGIFTFFAVEGFYGAMAKEMGVTVDQFKKQLADSNTTVKCGLPIVSGILGIVGGGSIVASQFVK